MLVVGVYSFARPLLNERLGWNLPEVSQETQPKSLPTETLANQVIVTLPEEKKSNPPIRKPLEGQVKKSAEPKASSKSATPRNDSSDPSATSQPSVEKKRMEQPSAKLADEELAYGILRDLGNERYVSPSGLTYTPGSAEGHRLEHLRRHTQNDPGRPGSHGVFDGGLEGALKTIDDAYEKAKAGTRTTKRVEDGRTIYTVDMGKRVGYVGGRDGGQKRNPMARRVTLVLEGTRVITAYPQ